MPLKNFGQQTCKRCNHVWARRVPHKPIRCPKCTSPYWNKPK